ncbi:hypothetical protein G7046_g6306 [Stylonectria norvegica]|nr:hypothetical protein G7046_g6306 [Stylonectria norvegica]
MARWGTASLDADEWRGLGMGNRLEPVDERWERKDSLRELGFGEFGREESDGGMTDDGRRRPKKKKKKKMALTRRCHRAVAAKQQQAGCCQNAPPVAPLNYLARLHTRPAVQAVLALARCTRGRLAVAGPRRCRRCKTLQVTRIKMEAPNSGVFEPCRTEARSWLVLIHLSFCQLLALINLEAHDLLTSTPSLLDGYDIMNTHRVLPRRATHAPPNMHL